MKKLLVLLVLIFFFSVFFFFRRSPDLFLCEKVTELFLSQRFEELDHFLDLLQKRGRDSFYAEERLFDAYYAFAVKDSAFEKLLDEWMSRRPASDAAHTAKAVYEMCFVFSDCRPEFLNRLSFSENASVYLENARMSAAAALKINAFSSVAYEVLMNVNQLEGKQEENLSLVQKALQNETESFLLRWSYLKNLALESNADSDDIRSFIAITLKSASGKGPLKYLEGFLDWYHGVVLARNKQFKEAASSFEKALSYGDYWIFHFDLAESCFYLNQFESALSQIQEAIKRRPEVGYVYLLRAKIYYRLGDFESAFQDIETAESIRLYDPLIQETKVFLVEDLIYQSYQAYQKRHFESALKLLNNALRLNSSHPEIYYWRGKLLEEEGKIFEALSNIRRSIKLNPSHYDSCAALYSLVHLDERGQEIADCWTNFILLNPNRADAYFERGKIYWKMRNKENACRDFKMACDLGLKESCDIYRTYQKE